MKAQAFNRIRVSRAVKALALMLAVAGGMVVWKNAAAQEAVEASALQPKSMEVATAEALQAWAELAASALARLQRTAKQRPALAWDIYTTP
ncbi:MAG TPA: hypothetical protein VK864_08510 [Longimicrobiales bacterium]|nr:hypothetical protein [Longimicrobiales bacterium]